MDSLISGVDGCTHSSVGWMDGWVDSLVEERRVIESLSTIHGVSHGHAGVAHKVYDERSSHVMRAHKVAPIEVPGVTGDVVTK
jgi:hypothetical protein